MQDNTKNSSLFFIRYTIYYIRYTFWTHLQLSMISGNEGFSAGNEGKTG